MSISEHGSGNSSIKGAVPHSSSNTSYSTAVTGNSTSPTASTASAGHKSKTSASGLPAAVSHIYYKHGLFLSSYPTCATSIAIVAILFSW